MSETKESKAVPSADENFRMPCWFVPQTSWLAEAGQASSSAFNYPLSIRLRGPLDRQALVHSLREVVRRHEALHLAFRVEKEDLFAKVTPPPAIDVSWIDLSDSPNATRLERARQIAVQEANHPFDLRGGLMLRAVLLRLAEEDHVLLLVTHHIVCDDWSSGILLRELGVLYGTCRAGLPSPLPEISYPYRNFVRWQQRRLQGKELESHLTFWKKRFEHSDCFYHLALDYPRPVQQTFQGGHEVTILSEELVNSLKALSQKERVSLFMSLLTGFLCLLHRYSGDGDIGVGCCVANRSLVEVEGLIGPFGNVLTLRTHFGDNPTFRDALARVREDVLTTLSYQELPFGQMAKTLRPEQRANKNPLFQALFVLENAPKENWDYPGLNVERFPLELGTTRYELNVWLRPRNGLELDLQYNTQLFSAATIQKMREDYRAILCAMTSNLDQRVADVSVVPRVPSLPGPSPAPHVAHGPAGARDRIESVLTEIWENILGKHPIGPHEDYFALGGDSLMAVRLFTQVDKRMGIGVPLATLFEAPTIAQLSRILREHQSARQWPSLVAVQPRGSRPPLFMVHGHFGEVILFRDLALRLGNEQPLYGLQAQGLNGEGSLATIAEMAAQYIREMQSVQPAGPYYLAGFCFGGMVVFEMAHQLRNAGHKVALVAMLNAPSPGSLDRWPWPLLSQVGAWSRFHFRKMVREGLRNAPAYLFQKGRGFLRYLKANLKARVGDLLSRTSRDRPAGAATKMLSLSELNLRAAKTYSPGVYSGPLALFITEEAPALYGIDLRTGWRSYTESGVDIFEVPGDTDTMLKEPFVAPLAQRLEECINKALRET